jgi:hypothetical protein
MIINTLIFSIIHHFTIGQYPRLNEKFIELNLQSSKNIFLDIERKFIL